MATVKITHNIKTPEGKGVPNLNVIARLNKPAVRIVDGSSVSRVQTFTTDSNGNVNLLLEKTTDMTPVDTYWIVEIQNPSKSGPPELYTIRSNTEATLQAAKVAV